MKSKENKWDDYLQIIKEERAKLGLDIQYILQLFPSAIVNLVHPSVVSEINLKLTLLYEHGLDLEQILSLASLATLSDIFSNNSIEDLVDLWPYFEGNYNNFINYFSLPLMKKRTKEWTYEYNRDNFNSSNFQKEVIAISYKDLVPIVFEYYLSLFKDKEQSKKYAQDMCDNYMKDFKKLGFNWILINDKSYREKDINLICDEYKKHI